uniref:Uncharacterized protein n=1 Tax=Salarias fasciatus TaxID=181472 RepID=A0A672HR51_SALFA
LNLHCMKDGGLWKEAGVPRENALAHTEHDTPLPGVYHIRDFIEEANLNPVRQTYGFKNVGRKALTLSVCKGDLLLPGAYDYTDFTQEVLKHPASYSFKNCPRPDILTLGIRDKTFFFLNTQLFIVLKYGAEILKIPKPGEGISSVCRREVSTTCRSNCSRTCQSRQPSEVFMLRYAKYLFVKSMFLNENYGFS